MGRTEAAIPDVAEAVKPPRDGERHEAAIALVASRGSQLRAIARRYSICADDADDAYQRSLEILLRKAPTTDEEALTRWMSTVIKREAFAVRRFREQLLCGRGGLRAASPDLVEAAPSETAGPADLALRREQMEQSAEALNTLKPDELHALVLLAEGFSYAEIGKITGWTYTKVNRCLTEGRRRFVEAYASIEAGRRCGELAEQLSAFCDGELSGKAEETVRRHLGSCGYCRATALEYRGVPQRVIALTPAVAVVAPAARPLLHRAHDWLVGAQLKILGAGDGVGTVAAASGGGRGGGLALAAKVLAVCAGTAGAGAACVATGVVPEPVRDQLPLLREHDAEPAQTQPRVPDTDAPAPPAPRPGQQTAEQQQTAPPDQPSPAPVEQEFSPEAVVSPQPSAGPATEGGGGSSGGAGSKPRLTGGSGEFGP
jgi:RNA polymerase sigma factor (sigma-70 family)